MTRQQIDRLRQHPDLAEAELIETHISWLLLTTEKVYKMKKNIQFSFLDFSELAQRKYYCEKELLLNRRLAPDLYEEVVAVNTRGEGLEFGPYQPDSLDYAIKMRRVDRKWEMVTLLRRGAVLPEHLDQLAEQLAVFHQSATPDTSLFNPIKALDDFRDISQYTELLLPHLGVTGQADILAGIETIHAFLRHHHQRFHDRRQRGFTVEGHGDLHAANVFLEAGKPLIFDCIEFNDAFRMVDVLDEVAFLYVDLEAFGFPDLAQRFASSYQSAHPTLLTAEDQQLFDFYKCYRANVRLKVTAIKVDRAPTEAHADEMLGQLQRYFQLYRHYVARLAGA